MASKIDKLLNTHENLVHSEDMKVVSHVQRFHEEWLINTIMIEGVDVLPPIDSQTAQRGADFFCVDGR